MRVCENRTDDVAAARLAAGVASYGLGVAQDAILDPKRGSAEAAFARQVAMYLCHTAFELSLARVAVAFERDRSTVAHACHAIEDRRDEAGFDAWLCNLEAMLRDAPRPGRRHWSAR
ncbi:MAG: chromosomal replication initiator DnaA [Hyphomonadaceae bacterium]|nr:chromosomal replication initiator DnaA [Hyphomonadaceae bacterium]